jgi:hypothetical protein
MYEEENEPTNTVSTTNESSTTSTRSGDTARALIRPAKLVSWRRFPSEAKIRVPTRRSTRGAFGSGAVPSRGDSYSVLQGAEGFHGGGQKGLRGDTRREANREEVEQLRQENQRLKQLVADLRLANVTLKRSQY